MESLTQLDARAKPPAVVREVYKAFQKLDVASLDADPDPIDLERYRTWTDYHHLKVSHALQVPTELCQIFAKFMESSLMANTQHEPRGNGQPAAFESTIVPGKLPPNIYLSSTTSEQGEQACSSIHLFSHPQSSCAFSTSYSTGISPNPNIRQTCICTITSNTPSHEQLMALPLLLSSHLPPPV